MNIIFDKSGKKATIRPMHAAALTQQLKERAHDLGFDLVGIARVGPTPQAAAYLRWLQAGCHGDMGYLARPDAVAARLDVRQRLPSARSLVALGVNYALDAPQVTDPSRGRIASFAWGLDYHEVLKSRLYALDGWLREQTGRTFPGKVSVDSAPVLERGWAQQTGIGFTGKNTCLIHPRLGSWLLLATLLAPEEMEYDAPAALRTPAPTALVETEPAALASCSPAWQFADGARGGCGGCTRCLVACPTRAFDGPFVLDARRCISYLTIELKGAIPRDLRPRLGNWIFGCDLCQAVCPWNGRRRQADAAKVATLFAPRLDDLAPSLLDLVELDDAGLRARFRGSPLRRAGRAGLLRNVCVALGNWGHPAAIPALTRRLADAAPLVRSHAAWALGRIDDAAARVALERGWLAASDPATRQEISLALDKAP